MNRTLCKEFVSPEGETNSNPSKKGYEQFGSTDARDDFLLFWGQVGGRIPKRGTHRLNAG